MRWFLLWKLLLFKPSGAWRAALIRYATPWGDDMLAFFAQNYGLVLQAFWVHLVLVLVSVAIAIVVALPIGVWATRNRRVAKVAIRVAGIIMTIPSVAIYGILIPVLALVGHGIGKLPAIVALVLYCQLPLIQNTYAGLRSVDESVKQAGRGMGMTSRQLFWSVEVPLAMPVILAGVRTAMVLSVGIAAIGAYIGAGGLGQFIFQGISRLYQAETAAGALALVVLALLLDGAFGVAQWRLIPKGGRSS